MDNLKILVLCLLPIVVFSQDAQFISHPVDTLVKVGNEVIFDCVLENVGGGAVSWLKGEEDLYRGIATIPDLYESDAFKECCELTGDTASGDFSMKIKSAKYEDAAAWKCKYSGGGVIFEEHGSLSVLDDLDCSVEDGTQNEGLYQVIEGNTKKLNCLSDGAPPGSLTWIRDGVDSESTGDSPLVWEPTFADADSNLVYDCELRHETLAEPISCENTISFDVQYKPVIKVDINPENKDGKVLEGKSFSADCMVVRAKPPIEGSGPTWSTTVEGADVGDSSSLNMPAVLRSQAGDYVCSAENVFFDGSTGKSEETVTLEVQYPPVLSLPQNYTFKVGDAVSINCSEKVTEANPPVSEFTWKRHNDVFQTGEVLTIDAITREDHGRFTCEAKSVFYDGSEDKAESNTEFVVQYKPDAKTPAVVALKEGESRDVVCNVEADPAPSTVKWIKLPGTDALSETETLTLTDVTLDDAGEYRCEASNTFYDGEVATNDEDNGISQVVVQFMASATLNGPTVPVGEGDKNIVLNCSVESEPKPNSYKWEFVNKAGEMTVLTETSMMLDRGVASREHAGNYTCTATNTFYDGTMGKSSASIVVSVNYAPDIMDKDDNMVAAEIGSEAKLICKATAEPDPTFKWLNATGGEIKNKENKYTIEEKYEDGVFVYTLTISDVVEADYASYECNADNGIGMDNVKVELSPITAPGPPVDVNVKETHHSLTVTWKAGFNGGEKQTFIVKLENEKLTSERLSDTIEDDGRDVFTHTFTGLDPNVDYLISVVAKNTKGESEPSTQEVKTAVPPSAGKRGGSSSSTVVIAVVVVILLLIIILGIVILVLVRRKRSSSYNTQKGEQAPQRLDEEVPLNEPKENDKGVSEFALDENEKNKKNKGKGEEAQPLKGSEQTPEDDVKKESDAPEETKIEEPQDSDSKDKSPTEEKGKKTNDEVVYAELDHGKPKEDTATPVKEPTQYATIDFARTSQRPGQPTSL
ncbi:nephrin-like isoform X2 [Ptychodera flava]|uniref:nephrin-like isoform X2 n=1 Tax=Ptychodera flava TaxID=63121 RepID=UPI003969D28D